MQVVTIVGARPQFIKAAALVRAIAKRPTGSIDHLLVHTGQHYDENMSRVFFEQLDLPQPDLSLGIGGGTHGAMTGAMLAKNNLMESQIPIPGSLVWRIVSPSTRSNHSMFHV